jgi:hypothetical protein
MNSKQIVLEKFQNPQWWIDQCLNDLYFLCRTVLVTLEDSSYGFKDLYAPTHKRICDFVQRYGVPGNKLLILTPRGWVKSYVITVGWTIQRLLSNLVSGRREHQIISNATLPNAKVFLEKIKHNLQYNELLRGLFRECIPEDPPNKAEKWTLDEFQLNGCLVETGSVEGNLVSRHYKTMINDDLVNKENSGSKEQLLKVLDWWRLSQSLLLSDGIEINIGTRWAYDDLYGFFIENFIQPKKDYAKGVPIVELHQGKCHLLQMDCWEDPVHETGSTFPTLFPEELLKELQKTLGERFNGQYRNDPLATGTNPFNPDWFRRWVVAELPPVRNTIMLIDPSGKAKVDSDNTGIVVIHLSSDKKGYIEYGKRHLITDRALADWIIFNAPKFKPDQIAIEDNKYRVIFELLELMIPQYLRLGKVAKDEIEFVKSLPYILIEVGAHGRPKPVRIRNVTGMFENGSFLLPYKDAEDLEEEMIRYPSLRDDVIDALAYVMDVLAFPSPSDPPKVGSAHLSAEAREEADWDRIREEDKVGGRDRFEDSDCLW